MKYSTLSYIEKLTELENIAKNIIFRDTTLSDFIDENNLIFYTNCDCLYISENETENKQVINEYLLACCELVAELNKHFTDTTFYLTHAEIDTENEYITVADFETIRDF